MGALEPSKKRAKNSATTLNAGSAIFSTKNYSKATAEMRAAFG